MSTTLLLVVVLFVGALALLVGLFALDRQGALSKRVEALFRRPQKPGKTPGSDHYYKPYWKG